ncbi:MAG: 3-deoxy-8-phosphooctulonate synthase [Chlamydiia bacterium]|nr:3-deoxy-8-phosphooctulonate synthase [Chlamydiia bacterium]
MRNLNKPFLVVTGPCVIESEKHTLECAETLKRLFEKFAFDFIFKASYDKANRSSIKSFRGPGLQTGLKILEKVKKEFEIPVFTDVHSPEEAIDAAEVCDVIQIPAFLCRQTDLLIAAGKTGTCINIKKGQFMAPWDMKQAILKIESTGNHKIWLTERGTCFGYNNLVSDMRGIPIMEKFGYPILYDATHSVQLPAGLGTTSSGQREFIPALSRAAIGAGCHGIYAESHPNPKEAKCDSATVLSFETLKSLLYEWERLDQVMRGLCQSHV